MTDDELNDLFKALSQSDFGNMDPAVDQRLRVAFRARRRRNRTVEYLMEIAASVAVALGLYFLLAGDGTTHRERAASRGTYADSEFVVLPYGQSDVPLEHPVIVRVQVPEAELGRLGISIPPTAKHGRVEADLLVGQDGIARAVRVNRRY